MARKTALLLGWENGNGRQGGPWKIGMEELFPALMIAELHLKSIISLSDIISEHGDARLRRTVLDALPPGALKSLGDIIAYTKMKKKTITEALDSLCEEGTVVRYNVTGAAPVFTRAAGEPTGLLRTAEADEYEG
jgi:hypothetical protein